MRDWLDGLGELGHETRLCIESADFEQPNPLSMAQACTEFRPDLIVAIDHFRAEYGGLPKQIPMVMWVQDRLPNIFNARGGAAQTAHDFVIGQGRVECVHQLGYPSDRFMPAMIGTNPNRFRSDDRSSDDPADVDPAGVNPSSLNRGIDSTLACDVSFVSHCSMPADRIVQAEIDRLNTPQARLLLQAIFDQLRAIYDAGNSIVIGHRIEDLIPPDAARHADERRRHLAAD